MPWWLPHSLTERWATGILAILARFFHYTILFFIHLIVNFAVLADRLMGTQQIQRCKFRFKQRKIIFFSHLQLFEITWNMIRVDIL